MAKRALGALPTVEPRSAPLFAPSTAGLASAESRDSGIQEVFAETENSSNGAANSRRKNQRLPLEESERRSMRDENPELQPMRERFRQTALEHLSADRAISEREVSRPSSRKVEAHQEVNSQREREPERKVFSLEVQKGTAMRGNRTEETETAESQGAAVQTRAVKAKVADAERSDSLRESIATSTKTERNAKIEPASIDDVAMPPTARSNAMRQQQSEQRSAARNETKASVPDAHAEQKTEIHISIGSIELRAPRVEARPQAAPFRPRVTLDDFLRRKPEAGR